MTGKWNALTNRTKENSSDVQFKSSVIGNTIIDVNQYFGSCHALLKFQLLAQKLGILEANFPINKAELLALDKIITANVEIIWSNFLYEFLLRQYEFEGNIPKPDAKAIDIIKFLNTKTFKEIKELNFSGLELTVFPSQILNCFPNIHTLDLSDNKIEMLQLNSKNLKTLCLNNNQFKDIPNVNCPNLHILELSDNKIKQLEYPKRCIKLEELILNKNQINEFALCSPTLRVLHLDENPLSRIKDLICPQLQSFSVYPLANIENEQLMQVHRALQSISDPQQQSFSVSPPLKAEKLIQVTRRLHCPLLPPADVQRLDINIIEFENIYNWTISESELAQGIICEKRLSQLVFETYKIDNGEPTWSLDSLLNTVYAEKKIINFEGITELDLSDLNLKAFPIDLLQHFPDLKELDLRGNPIENLEDLKGYPNLIVHSDKKN